MKKTNIGSRGRSTPAARDSGSCHQHLFHLFCQSELQFPSKVNIPSIHPFPTTKPSLSLPSMSARLWTGQQRHSNNWRMPGVVGRGLGWDYKIATTVQFIYFRRSTWHWWGWGRCWRVLAGIDEIQKLLDKCIFKDLFCTNNKSLIDWEIPLLKQKRLQKVWSGLNPYVVEAQSAEGPQSQFVPKTGAAVSASISVMFRENLFFNSLSRWSPNPFTTFAGGTNSASKMSSYPNEDELLGSDGNGEQGSSREGRRFRIFLLFD